jgi:hypothetical protein
MKLNEYDLVDRSNRPTTSSKVAIQIYFLNDGSYYDPYDIKDVTIFRRDTFTYPSSILDQSGLIPLAASAYAKGYFAASAGSVNGYQDPSSYFEGASSIYRIDTGQYVAVLDGDFGTTGYVSAWDINVVNGASAVGEYLDIWTIKNTANSDYQTVINSFYLQDDTFVTVTEPIIFNTNHRLITKKIPLGSKKDVKITTSFVVENANLNDAMRNLITNAAILNPAVKIEKINEDPNIPARVTVSGYENTSGVTTQTGNDTIIFTWDTENLKTHPEMVTGNLGNMRGIYVITLKYDLLSERIVTPQMYLQLV